MFIEHHTLVYLVKLSGCLGAGMCMGFGAIGSSYGIGSTGRGAITGIARQPKVSGDLTKTMLIGQAVTESPAIFALVTAILLLFIDPKIPHVEEGANNWQVYANVFAHMCALIGAGISMGFAALGPGIGDGVAGDAACEAVARTPEERGSIMRTMLIGQATAQSTSVYGFVISLCLIYLTAP